MTTPNDTRIEEIRLIMNTPRERVGQQDARYLLETLDAVTEWNRVLQSALVLAEKYLVDRGIEHIGTVGRTQVLPVIRTALAPPPKGAPTDGINA